MKTSRKMQEVVTAIAAKYGLDLKQKGAYLRLNMPHYDPLVVEVLHEKLVNVAHVYEPHPDIRIGDPASAFSPAMTYGCRLKSANASVATASMRCCRMI